MMNMTATPVETLEFATGSSASSSGTDTANTVSLSINTGGNASESDSDDWSVADHEYYREYTPVLQTTAPTPHDAKRQDYELRLGVQQATLSRRRHLVRAYEAYKYEHYERENAREAADHLAKARDTQRALPQRRFDYWEALRHTNAYPEKRKLKAEFNGFWAKHRGGFNAHPLK